MSKLKGILLTQGMHGMISQVEGLAKALDLEFTHHTVELNKFWKFFPPKFTPVSQNVFKKIDTEDYDVIISCGRKSVIPSIFLKKNSSKIITNIHIQDPKVGLNNFNYVIVPEHDGLSGENVLSTNELRWLRKICARQSLHPTAASICTVMAEIALKATDDRLSVLRGIHGLAYGRLQVYAWRCVKELGV